MLSIDPTFAFVKQWPAVKNIMQVGRWFTGQQAPLPVTPARFMYNNVGEVYLIKWTVGQGHKVSSNRLVHYNTCFKPQLAAVQSWTVQHGSVSTDSIGAHFLIILTMYAGSGILTLHGHFVFNQCLSEIAMA